MKGRSRNVAVVTGGDGLEAEVARVSAAEICTALARFGHRFVSIEMNADLASTLLSATPDVVFPAVHGAPGEDGTLQGLLEMLELPYVGSEVRGSCLAMDKHVAKKIFRDAGLPVTEDLLVLPHDETETARSRILERFGPSVVIKAGNLGSAIGVSRVLDERTLQVALEEARRLERAVLVEPLLSGTEVSVGVLDLEGDALTVFPPVEIRTAKGEWYDFKNRYAVGASEHVIPAELSAATNARLQTVALAAHRGLGLRDLSRADFIVSSDSRIMMLETNTLPGMTPASLYPDGARAAGYPFPELVNRLLSSALRRHAT